MIVAFHFLFFFLVQRIVADDAPNDEFDRLDPKAPKFFAVDIDGTLYTDEGPGMARNVVAFGKAFSRGYNVFLATGRSPRSARNILGENFFLSTGYSGYPGVYLDGALVYDKDGQIIRDDPLKPQFVEKFAKLTAEDCRKYTPIFVTSDIIFTVCPLLKEEACLYESYSDISGIMEVPVESLKYYNIYKIFCMNGVDALNAINATNEDCHMASTSAGLTQILSPTADKAAGVKALLGYFGTDFSNCGCAGDGLNDVELMKAANFSYAVGNAMPAAKSAAKYRVTHTNHTGGVAKILNEVYGIVV
ncbi:haloacid dehalogenase-like hydrolase family member protein [Babesia caballi]|uniref:Haloacid dehalogenase-like hydrolase family member protein n=1 Tax=Babesia caballi TaxID=5871 RepID=A0AAV4M3K6_BABCB|nr:haloacid dehalogenase-like hydrolase family member protein [Babesia caballi]